MGALGDHVVNSPDGDGLCGCGVERQREGVEEDYTVATDLGSGIGSDGDIHVPGGGRCQRQVIRIGEAPFGDIGRT